MLLTPGRLGSYVIVNSARIVEQWGGELSKVFYQLGLYFN